MFRLTINYQRFLFLLRCLTFDDRATRAERMQIDNLAAVREICDVLQAKFREAYTPGENVTIDEQLIGFRGRFKGKVYMPSKPNKYGIKIKHWWTLKHSICYLLRFILANSLRVRLPSLKQS